MRLRQLARKLEVSPEKIIGLLAEAGDTLTNEANGKLTAEQVVIVESHYGKTNELNEPIEAPVEELIHQEEIQEEQKKIEEPPVDLDMPLGPPADVTSQISAEFIEEDSLQTRAIETTGRLFKAIEDEEEDPNIEVIKAPKIELEGLKVIGKIDLPEPKPKKEDPPKHEDEEAERPQRNTRKRESRNSGGRDRGRKRNGSVNPIEEERKRQERIALRKKRDQEAAIKKRKEQNYLKQLKSKPAPKKPKKKVVPKEEPKTSAPVLYQSQASTQPSNKTVKKNPIRRFWGWLNGEYDQF